MHIEYDDFGEYMETIDYVIHNDSSDEPFITAELVVADYSAIKAESAKLYRSKEAIA